jgi:hypothetical protein
MAGSVVREVDITAEEIRGQVKVRANGINLGAKVLNLIRIRLNSSIFSLLRWTESPGMHEIQSLGLQ